LAGESEIHNSFQYKIYNFIISSDTPIAGLEAFHSEEPTDLVVRFRSLPERAGASIDERLRYASAYLNQAGEPILKICEVDDGAYTRIAYPDGTAFWFNRELNELWVNWPEQLSLENTLSYLTGPVMGIYLRLRGVVCLHASVVAIGDRCVAMVGAEGAGKSTTAAGFAKLGYGVLSDDIAALDERSDHFFVRPGHPRINLWPKSVSLLYGSPEALSPISEGWDKRYLALGQGLDGVFADRALPLGAIYVLDLSLPEAPSFERMSQRDAMMALVANTYAANFLDAQQRAEEFQVLSRLLASVPVRRVNPRRDVLPVLELCEMIRADFDVA
jgi:hypothetical protein